jgi:DNA polymerase III gamma/tau subunit
MEITHKTVKIKLAKDESIDAFSASSFEKLQEIAQKISLGELTKIWQMLLKGNNEVNYSNSAKISFEMLLARICHLSNLPDLKNLIMQTNSQNSLQNENNLQINVDENNNLGKDKINDELAQEILRNFEGAKLIS